MGSAVQLNEAGEHTFGNTPYHPMYPVYNFNTQPFPQPTAFTPQNAQPYAFGNDASTSSAPPQAAPGSISEDGIIQKY